jgi:hypothetical protein
VGKASSCARGFGKVARLAGLDSLKLRADADGVIPTLLLIGLVFGRWWKVAVPAAVIGWPILLIASGVDSGLRFAVTAGLLAAANVVVGALAYSALRLIARGFAALPNTTRLIADAGPGNNDPVWTRLAIAHDVERRADRRHGAVVFASVGPFLTSMTVRYRGAGSFNPSRHRSAGSASGDPSSRPLPR